MKWLEQAACDGDKLKLWFSQSPEDVEYALGICGRCPVIGQCREANKDEPFGVFGGTTALERMGSCAVPTKSFPDGRTGTRAGYVEHSRNNESPCQYCTESNADYQSMRLNAKKERVK